MLPILEARVEGCEAEIYLNGIPLTTLTPDDCYEVSIPAAQYVVPGENRVQMAINPGPSPSTATRGEAWTAPREARAAVQLTCYPQGAVPGDGSGLCHFALTWSGDGQEGGTRLAEGVVDWPSDRWPSAAGPWSWQSAPPLDLQQHQAAITQFIGRVHRAMATRDIQFMINLAALHLRDLVAAYQLDWGEQQQEGRGIYQELFAKPDWAMEPLDPETYDLRLCAGGRLVECVRHDRDAILRSEKDAEGNRYNYPMMLGVVGGQLQVLRQ